MPAFIESVDREELYERAWSTPMSNLASKYGISDVGMKGLFELRYNCDSPDARPSLRTPTRPVFHAWSDECDSLAKINVAPGEKSFALFDSARELPERRVDAFVFQGVTSVTLWEENLLVKSASYSPTC